MENAEQVLQSKSDFQVPRSISCMQSMLQFQNMFIRYYNGFKIDNICQELITIVGYTGLLIGGFII